MHIIKLKNAYKKKRALIIDMVVFNLNLYIGNQKELKFEVKMFFCRLIMNNPILKIKIDIKFRKKIN